MLMRYASDSEYHEQIFAADYSEFINCCKTQRNEIMDNDFELDLMWSPISSVSSPMAAIVGRYTDICGNASFRAPLDNVCVIWACHVNNLSPPCLIIFLYVFHWSTTICQDIAGEPMTVLR